MPPAGDRPSQPPPTGSRRELGLWIEDALVLASAVALGVCAFRAPLGLRGWQSTAIMGATLAAMAVVAVLRIRRLIRMRRARAQGRKDGSHAD